MVFLLIVVPFTDKRSINEYGFGDGLRMAISSDFNIKLSYEYALQLSKLDELFGNGQFILKNLELVPETSYNLNFRRTYRNIFKKDIVWGFNGNFFLREIDDLIFAFIIGYSGSFDNVSSARSSGMEIGGSWVNDIPGIVINANATYINYINTSKTGQLKSFKEGRLPNQPYLYANGNINYRLKNIYLLQDTLTFFTSSHYIYGFFVGWESAGLQYFKLKSPNQLIRNTEVTYNFEFSNLTNSLTAEVQNVTNSKVFDFFGVQRTGRSVFMK